MKIISKFKDYYDYLMGIYGIDEKLILDRTEFFSTPDCFNKEGHKLRFYICDKEIECLYVNGNYYYGEEIKQLCTYDKQFWNDDNSYWFSSTIFFTLKEKTTDINKKMNCPAVMNWRGNNNNPDAKDLHKFPILKDYSFAKAIDAHTIWVNLSAWLANQKEEPRNDNMTNEEKIISHGFDKKKSFRK